MAVMGALAVVCVAAIHRADADNAEHERSAVVSAVTSHAHRMGEALRALAEPNERELLRRLSLGDKGFVHEALGQPLYRGGGYEYTLILDGRGRLIFSSVNGTEAGREKAIEWLLPHLPRVLADAGLAEQGFKLLQTSERAGILVSRPFTEILPDLHEDQPLVVVTVDVLDRQILSELGAPAAIHNLHLVSETGAEAGNSVALDNLADRPAVRLAWRPRYPAGELMRDVLPAVATLATILCGVFLVLLLRARRAGRALAASEARARALAYQDHLTGLSNRGRFIEQLEARLKKRGAGETLALMFVDLDGFKEINDSFGHGHGDGLLRVVADRLREWREGVAGGGNGLVARFGGDEFVLFVVLPEPETLTGVLNDLTAAIGAPIKVEGSEMHVSACIGVACAPRDATAVDDLLRRADIALYRAKAAGDGTHCRFEPGFETELVERRRTEGELSAALDSGQLALLYQPLVDVESERVIGFEALVRWDHPARGRLLPGDFVPVAEAARLVDRLDEQVLRAACLDARRLPGVTLCVNMSGLTLRRRHLVEDVAGILQETGFDPARLEIEIAERAIVGADAEMKETLERLRALGIRIALDDFGTVHASLVHVRRFPISKIKIDRSLVLNLGVQRDAAAIVEYVVRLGRSLGILLAAEGVETREQLRFLRAFGAQQAQGYLFSPPMPLEAAAALIERQSAGERARAVPRRPPGLAAEPT